MYALIALLFLASWLVTFLILEVPGNLVHMLLAVAAVALFNHLVSLRRAAIRDEYGPDQS
jgi:putative effector of murein hydrolase LrgA (UPF0299 family)